MQITISAQVQLTYNLEKHDSDQGIDQVDISDSVTYHITKTGNVLRQLAAKRIKDAGLNITPEESVLLNQLWDQDNQTISQLGEWSVKEPSTLTRQIDGLVKKNYVSRIHGETDRRKVYVKLTSKGKALQKAFSAARVRELDSDVAQMSDKDMKRFLEMLLRIKAQALEEMGDLK